MISLRDVVTGFGNRDPLAEVLRRSLRGGGGGATEITGVPPLRYIGDGRPLTDYRIAGNTLQDGTPSPDAPVDATGCGVRTGNLVNPDDMINGYFYNQSGVLTENSKRCTTPIFEISGTKAVISYSTELNGVSAIVCTFANGELVDRTINVKSGTNIGISQADSIAISFYSVNISVYVQKRDLQIMLNLGSTALPYEPYGFKLPLTVNGTEHPIYLGQVETTRRIKKLLLTGDEIILRDREREGSWRFFTDKLISAKDSTGICSHFENIGTNGVNDSDNIGFSIFNKAQFGCRCPKSIADTVTDFKAYLAAQYANGTPVTVWYVLAEPETAVVNEPLMKIGDYADTISFAQSQVAIPTVNGENILTVPTTVPPSEVTIKGGISNV